jgi:hypothetical protein
MFSTIYQSPLVLPSIHSTCTVINQIINVLTTAMMMYMIAV